MTTSASRTVWFAALLVGLLGFAGYFALIPKDERGPTERATPGEILKEAREPDVLVPTLIARARPSEDITPHRTGGTIEVEVVTEDGLPVSGARVQVVSQSSFRASVAEQRSPWGEEGAAAVVRTGASGRATVGVPLDWPLVAVRATHEGRHSAPALAVGVGDNVQLVLTDSPQLIVEVVSTESGLVPNATIVAVGQALSGQPVRLEAITGADGTAGLRVPRLRFGRLSLTVSAPGHAMAVDLAPPGASRVRIEVRPASDVHLTILDASRQPVKAVVYWRVEVAEESSGIRTWSRYPAHRAEAPAGVAILVGVPPEARLLACAVAEDGSSGCMTVEPARSSEIVVVPGGTVVGRVLDPSDRPVAGVRIHLMPPPASSVLAALNSAALGDLPFLHAISNASGEFLLRSVPAHADSSAYALRVIALGMGSACRLCELIEPTELAVASGARTNVDLRVRVLGPTRVSGVVRDEGGKPIAGARVALGYTDLEVRAVSALDGTYSFEACGLGSFQIHCRAKGYVDFISTEQQRLPDGRIALDIDLLVGGEIFGTLVDAGGGPMGGVLLVAIGVNGSKRGLATTRADGTFRIDGLAAGDYRLVAMRSALSGFMPEWIARVPQQAPATLHLPPDRIQSQVRISVLGGQGESLKTGTVLLAPIVAGEPSRRPSGRSEREFLFEDIPAGRYHVVWIAGDQHLAESMLGEIVVASTATSAAFRIPEVWHTSGIVSTADGHPVVGLALSVQAAESSVQLLWRNPVRTDAAGRFSLALGEGDYELRAYNQEMGTRTTRVVLGPGSAPQSMRLRAVPAGSVQFVLKHAGSAPVAAVSIELVGRDTVRWSAPSVRRDGLLTGEVLGLLPGTYVLRLTVDGELFAESSIQVSAGVATRFEH